MFSKRQSNIESKANPFSVFAFFALWLLLSLTSSTSFGEQIKTTYPGGGTATTDYDRNGNETRNCERGVCTNTAYDALDRPTKVTDAANNVTETVYDAAGQVTKEIDPRGNATEYQYFE